MPKNFAKDHKIIRCTVYECIINIQINIHSDNIFNLIFSLTKYWEKMINKYKICKIKVWADSGHTPE